MSLLLRSSRTRLLALALVPLALLAACGGDDEPEATTSTSTSTTTTEAPADGATDEGAEAWSRNATEFRDRVGDQVDVECPPQGQLGTVWGSNVYTDDSSICSAAVHAGLITVDEGGEVTFELIDGQEAYEGSESNGITSNDFGPYGGSFRFVD